MKGDQFNPVSGIQRQNQIDANAGLSMGDILALPPAQRRIVNWMIRKKESTLPEVAEYIGENEQSALHELDALVEQGFLQEVQAAGSSRYYIKLAAKRGSQLAERITQVQTIGKPLATIISPSGVVSVSPGSVFELCITVSNQGNQSALIDVLIDEVSEVPLHWLDSSRERLALGRGQTSEVFFRFQVPVEALPGFYDYTLIVDARQHYPEDTPILHPGRLQVTPLIQETRKVNDPTFFLQPPTSSTSPTPVQPGQLVEQTVFVHNRSDRVDQFRLTCPDLAPAWYSVIYPEGFTDLGIVVAADALELNPGDNGTIQLLLKPPPDTWSGIYSPTVRLYSTNNPELVLLNVVYLQVLPVYQLNVELVTLVGKVKNQAGLFELRLHNLGNISREVIVRVISSDEDKSCTYTVTPSLIQLAPGASATVSLEVQPKHSWRRPFYGRLINFVIELEDTQQLPLIPDRFQGALMWEARPWWQFLLLVLSVLGLIGVLIFLIWLLWPRPLAAPQIVEFVPQSGSYREADGDVVRLNWKIANPRQVQSLKLEGLSPDGRIISEPIVYDLRQGIPSQLKNFCVIQQLLICQNVPTDARKAGDYIFSLTLSKTGRSVTSHSLKTSLVRIEPLPLPQIVEFASAKPVYQESPDTASLVVPGKASLQNRPTTPAESMRSIPVFSTSSTTQNRETMPTPSQNQRTNEAAIIANRNNGILLNWTITNVSQIQELRLIGRATDGTVNSPLRTYKFNLGVPAQLKDFCKLSNEELTCQNVPTDARKAGTYIFELAAIPKQAQAKPLEPKKTDPIKIIPIPIPTTILEFKINGKDVLPKYLVEIDSRKPIVLIFSWKVKGSKNTKVELLPAPGTVPLEGKAPYPLSQEVGSETITLQVTDEAGKQISRSVTIATVAPPPLSTIPILPAPTIPNLPPPPPSEGAIPTIPSLPPPAAPPPTTASSESPATPTSEASPSTPATPPPLPPPPGSTPPVPPGRNSPPPAELPPQLN